jgi:fibronectin-binding autotransporter adhesin
MKFGNSASKRALLGGASVMAALAIASSAQAACTTAGGTTTCTGDNAPFTVASDTPTVIAEGATVAGSGLSAIRLNSTRANLRIDGTVSATGAAALTVQNGERELVYDPYAGASPLSPYVYPYYYPTGRATIVIGEQGTISGDTGIWIERSSSNYLGGATATIDNSGLITASSGAAIKGPATTGIGYTILNRASGTIHGIAAIASISNAGLIDGRGEAAVTILPSNDPVFGGLTRASITNSGTITSAAAATIMTQQNPMDITNSGLIGNSNGGLSIDAANGLTLTNSGTIEGNVIVRADSSSIDSRQGTIKGDVLLGSGDDVILAAIDENGRLKTGITGRIDGGAGFNAVGLAIAADTALTGTPLLPTNFSLLRMVLENDAKLTLDAGFVGTSHIFAGGSGTLLNQGRIETEGNALEALSFSYPGSLNLINEGVIKANLSSPTDAAVSIDAATLANKGSIAATGGIGVLLKSGSGTTLTNSGTISADGAPAVLFGGGYASSGRVENLRGGVIRGDTVAIAILPDSSPYSYSATSITNAGSIIGHVDLTGRNSADRFLMQQGGSVTGDVRLGAGNDSYFFEGQMGSNGFLTGILGVLDGGEGNDQLLARLTGGSTITLGNYTNFETVGLDIAAGKLVTVTGSTGGAQLSLYGKGSADLSLSISGQNANLIDASGYGFSFPGDNNSPYVQTGTTIISRGALTAAFDSNAYGGSAVQLDQLDRFTNEGSITLAQATNPYGIRASAINGALEVVNKGAIILDGGAAIAGVLTVVNSGTVREAAGGASAVGISSVGDLINSGTISTTDIAVYTYDGMPASLINSGTIQSGAAQAIRGGYSSRAVIVNQAGGTIGAGSGFEAIALASGGAISNAGTINGSVNLAYSPYGGTNYASGAYVDRGGTLNGDLLFGAGDDIFIATGDTLSITGTIDAGEGIDSFVRAYEASRTVDLAALPALPTGFERQGIGALGSGTVVTLTADGAFHQPLTLVGDGTIVNLANISADAGSPERLLTLGTLADPFNLSGAGSTLRFINRGTIGDGISGYAARFENEGVIANSLDGTTAVLLTASGEDSFAFRNSGTIRSADNDPYFYYTPGVAISGATGTQLIGEASVANSGTIDGGMSLSLNAKDFRFSNEGSITRASAVSPSVALSLGQGYYYDGTDINADRATIGNSGALGNGMVANVVAKALTFTNSGTIGSSLYGIALDLAQSSHQTGGTTQGLYGAIDQDSFSFANSGTIDGSAYLGSNSAVTSATNSGTINRLSVEGSSLGNQSIAIANSGRIGTDALGASALPISSTALSAEQQLTGFDPVTGPVEGGPTTIVTLTNNGVLSADGGASYRPASPPPFPWYPSMPESLDSVAALRIGATSGGLSSIKVTNEAGGVISAIGATRNAADSQNPVVAGLEAIGSTAFVGSANQISLINAGTIRGLEGGIVPETLANDLSGQFMAGAIQTFNSADTVINLATGVITGSVDLGARDDQMANYGTINGNVYLGEGNDRFTHGLGATLNGTVDGGAGIDALFIDITGGGLLTQATFDKFVSFEGQSITGQGTITTNGPLSIDSLVLRDAQLTLGEGQTLETTSGTSVVFAEGTNSLTNLGTIKGALSFAGGTNSVVNLGSIAGSVTLNGGGNSFTIGAGSSVTGPVTANGIDDLLVLATGGTDAAPQELRLAGFTGFERTRQDSGTLALSADFTTGALTIAGGRFIGRTGSVINAGSILVKGATFGSAGTVNGNIAVQGTLSPGSSPGTMIVNGNVALAGSSTTLFEMTPTVSDALIVKGTLSIAPGATLRITGDRPLTPGVTYELITATSGIVGSFTTIDKASSVVGFVRQGNRSIDLLGQFVLGSGASGQVTQTVDYLNGLLIAGTATSGILAAAPSLLLADGSVNQAAVARLNGEAYASASQIGIENGLAIAAALRTTTTSMQGDEAGLFTFGQALGGWRRLAGDATLGTSRANVSTYGALAGIGFGTQGASFGAYVGYIDARQQITGLQARTDADGMLAGLIAQGAAGSFQVAASLSYDGSKADTDRTLSGGSKVSSHYRLSNWTADLSLGHAFAWSNDWTITPEIGVTHISSRRSGANETGDAVWALDVEARRIKATFLRGALELRGSVEAQISPWLSAGMLHQLSGRKAFATGAYAGVADGLTVAGVRRSQTLATVAAGASLRVSTVAALFFGTSSEFGAESSGQSATVGFRLRF